jgi:NDP-sugar pyrophosphorylase family protein
MHGLILAGGEGARLATGGIHSPKPVVEIAGEPQILRLIATFEELGCETITCMVRDAFPEVLEMLRRTPTARPMNVVACHTPSSLHTLVKGFHAAPTGNVFCSAVDSVMRERDWRDVYRGAARHLASAADAVLAVTPYVDDETPLWVERGDGGFVRRLHSRPVEPPCVTGGVYAFSPRARDEAIAAERDGLHRMRAFLTRLVERGACVATVDVPRIIDVDRERDLEVANAWLKSTGE